MTLNDVLKKDFGNSEKLILTRFKSSKLLFVGMSLLFFSNYFLLANFADNKILIFLLPIVYIGFLISFLLITYYSLKIKFGQKLNNTISIALILFLIIIGIIFSSSFLLDSQTLSNLI